MGGEDLGSDDEKYLGKIVSKEHIEVEIDETNEPKKRKTPQTEADFAIKRLNSGKNKNLLIETGREIYKLDKEIQATFLRTCYNHFLGNTNQNVDKIKSPSFLFSPNFAENDDKKMSDFLKNSVSSNKLKKWNKVGSVMILIACISAKRAVSVLKNISPLKVRAAKLFSKHITISDQKEMLKKSFSVAVGTPNRLLKLFKEGALTLDGTELFVIDCWQDSKRFTVCTLNDTGPDLMRFIQEAVLTNDKDSIKFAFY